MLAYFNLLFMNCLIKLLLGTRLGQPCCAHWITRAGTQVLVIGMGTVVRWESFHGENAGYSWCVVGIQQLQGRLYMAGCVISVLAGTGWRLLYWRRKESSIGNMGSFAVCCTGRAAWGARRGTGVSEHVPFSVLRSCRTCGLRRESHSSVFFFSVFPFFSLLLNINVTKKSAYDFSLNV